MTTENWLYSAPQKNGLLIFILRKHSVYELINWLQDDIVNLSASQSASVRNRTMSEQVFVQIGLDLCYVIVTGIFTKWNKNLSYRSDRSPQPKSII